MGVKVNVGRGLVKSNGAVARGSIKDVAKATRTSIADVFATGVKYVILVDTSSSMGARDARDMRRRYNVAVEELKVLQERLSGNVAVFSFNDQVVFEPSGVPSRPTGGTRLYQALVYVQPLDNVPVVERFVLISDGEPDGAEACLELASEFSKPIDTIYVGPGGMGAQFLKNLSAKQGGKSITSDSVKGLADSIQLMIEGGK